MKRLLLAGLLLATSTAVGCSEQHEAAPDQQEQRSTPQPATSDEKSETATPQQPPSPDASKPQDIQTAVSEVEFSQILNTFEELAAESDIAIEGKVIGSSPFEFHPEVRRASAIMTQIQVEVKKSFNDTVKEGDVITVIEKGGLTTKRGIGMGDKFPEMTPEQLDEKVRVIFAGVPLMAVNDDVFLFAAASDMVHGPNGETYYGIPGVIQGKFKIKDNRIIRDVPKSYVPVYKDLDTDLAEAETKVQRLMEDKQKN